MYVANDLLRYQGYECTNLDRFQGNPGLTQKMATTRDNESRSHFTRRLVVLYNNRVSINHHTRRPEFENSSIQLCNHITAADEPEAGHEDAIPKFERESQLKCVYFCDGMSRLDTVSTVW